MGWGRRGGECLNFQTLRQEARQSPEQMHADDDGAHMHLYDNMRTRISFYVELCIEADSTLFAVR